jgi:hypothetical protein
MAARSNALSEIVRFWLQECHGLFLRESIPVKVKYGNSDIDFIVTSPTDPVTLLKRITFNNAIVETKDERDYDKNGTKFANFLSQHYNMLSEKHIISAETKCHFSMLKKQHHSEAEKIFKGAAFSKIFIFHNLKIAGIENKIADLGSKGIHFVTSFEVLTDIHEFFKNSHPGAGIRNPLVGDILDMLISYHKWEPSKC